MKLLGDLNFKEFEALVENNEKLYNEAVENAEQTWQFWTTDCLNELRNCRGVNYEINCCGYSYISFDKYGNVSNVVEALKTINRNYGLFYHCENFAADVDRLTAKAYDYEHDNIGDARFYEWYEEKLQSLLDYLCDYIVRDYKGLIDNCISGFYEDVRANEWEYYTDGQDVYIIKTPAVIENGECFYRF